MTNRALRSDPVKLLPTKWPLGPLGGQVNSVAISGDGRTVIAGTYNYPANNQQFGTYAFDMYGNPLWQYPHSPTPNSADTFDNGIYSVALSRDGKWAASGGGDHKDTHPLKGVGYIYAYDVINNLEITIVDPKSNVITGGVNKVVLSDDGSYLVAGADAAYVFQRQGPQFVRSLAATDKVSNGDRVTSVGVSNDGLIVYGTDPANRANPGWIVLRALPGTLFAGLNGLTWQLPQTADGKQQHVTSVAMAAGGRAFAVLAVDSGPSTCTVYYFRTDNLDPSGQLQYAWFQVLNGCNYGGLSVAISDDGSVVSAVGNVGSSNTTGLVFLFDGDAGVLKWTRTTSYGPNSTSVDAIGGYVTVADGFKTAGGDFYLLNSLGDFLALPAQPNAVSWTMQISANGNAIAAGTDDGFVYYFAKPSAGWQVVKLKPRPIEHLDPSLLKG